MMQVNKIIQPPVGADLSRTQPIDRPSAHIPPSELLREDSSLHPSVLIARI